MAHQRVSHGDHGGHGGNPELVIDPVELRQDLRAIHQANDNKI